MNKLLLLFSFVCSSLLVNAQCTINNATGCRCKSAGQNDCDLLPDIQIGHPPFYDIGAQFGVIEYSQSGNPDTSDDGKLYVTVSTPNTGHGPLELYTVDTFVCGPDTFYGTPPPICPDGVSYPRIFMNQRIYHKSGNTMTSWTRFAGTMTYHPAHTHMHVDNWGNYTLRTRDTLEPNPLNWPLIGFGTKLAFCVMDYGTCAGYPGHCLDSAGNPLNSNSDFPNYGLGGGNYSCSPVVQGISSGNVDIYWTSLEGMYIELPPDLCNGDYYIVCEVDPNNNFLEEDETNNYYAAPIHLEKQMTNPASESLRISIANSGNLLCQGESVILSAYVNMPNVTYRWNNGDLTPFTTIDSSGTYYVDVTNQCGTGRSIPVEVTVFTPPAAPVGINDTLPAPGVATLAVTSANPVTWFDQPTGGNPLGNGNTFVTPFLNTSTVYYAEAEESHAGAILSAGLADSAVAGQGSYSNTNQALIFDCYNDFTLHSVTVYANNNINSLVIQLFDSSHNLVNSATVNVNAGMNVVVLDFAISPGYNYELTRSSGSLFRNNPGTNAGYPFTIPNYLSITGTTAGAGYYYFFYDWDIRLPGKNCTSARTPVLAHIALPNSIADVSVLNSLKVYPNPAKDKVNISFRVKDKKALVEIYSALGKTIFSREIYSNGEYFEDAFPVESLSRGIYIIHILSSGKNYYHRFVKE